MFIWLSKKLFNEGYNIHFCSLYDNNEINLSPIPTDCLNFKFFKSYLLRNLWYFIVGFYKLTAYLHRNKIKYIVCFGLNSFYLLGILKLILGFKLISSERGDPAKKRFSCIRKKLFAICEGTVFQTEGAKSFYDCVKPDKSHIIPNPVKIPTEIWSKFNTGYKVIAVGRIDIEQKRLDILIKAFSKVVKSIPQATLTIVGKGSDTPLINDLICKYNLSNNVELIGFKKDILNELKKANIYVLSSDFEGIPNSLMEAMAFGMPVISTDCSPGGAAFLIKNKYNGILVPRGNKEALADAMIELLNDYQNQYEYGKKARKSMHQFDENIIIEQWKNAINSAFEFKK